jgi:hypothetical protein
MAEVVRTTRSQAMKLAVVIAGGLGSANTAFWFLSALYFGPNVSERGLDTARIAFLVLTLVIAVASFIAALAPRLLGHGIAFGLGAASLVAGVEAIHHDMPAVMGGTLLVVGGLMPVLAYKSLHHSRAAWAFLIALVAVFGGVDFFGAPKVRGLLGIGLWTALIVPGLQIVCVIALTMLRGEYREHAET